MTQLSRTFSNRLNYILEHEYGGNVDEMVLQTGIPKRSLRYYLAGERLPSMEILVRLRDYTGYEIDWYAGYLPYD